MTNDDILDWLFLQFMGFEPAPLGSPKLWLQKYSVQDGKFQQYWNSNIHVACKSFIYAVLEYFHYTMNSTISISTFLIKI